MHTKYTSCLHLLVLFIIFETNAAAKYLSEKPSFLTPCPLSDPGFNHCLAVNFQALFRQWKNGIPGTTTLGSLDPLYIKRVKFLQDSSRSIAINADLQEVYVKGASQAVVKEAGWDQNHHIARVTLFVPKLRFDFDYKLKGHVLTLNLNSQGKGYFESENAVLKVELAVAPRVTPEASFADVQTVKMSFPEIGGFHIQLDNIFGVNKELGDTANMLFNQNWREFYDVLRPAIEQTVEAVLLDRFKRTFAYVPGNYFIENFH